MTRKKVNAPIDPPAPPDTEEETSETEEAPPAPAKAAKGRDPLKTIEVDLNGTGSYSELAAPRGYFYDRRITLSQKVACGNAETGYFYTEVPVNLEHVADASDGVWRYRVM